MNGPGTRDPAATSGVRMTRDVLSQVLGGVLNAGLGVVATLAIARGLGGAAFGQWATIFAVVQIASFVTDFGIEGATVRRAADDLAHEREWLGAAAAVRLLLTLPVVAICTAALLVISTGSDMRAAALIVTGTLLLGVPGVVANVAFGLRVRNDLLVATITLNSVLWTTAVVLLAPGPGDLARLALAFLIAGTLTALLQAALVLRRTHIRWRPGRARRRDLGRLALPIGLGSVLVFAYARIDQVLVYELAGARDAGLYGAAYRVLVQGAFVPVALMTTLFPILTAARADPERLRSAVQSAIEYLLMIALPALVFVLVDAEPLMRTLFGAPFSGAAAALRILMVALLPIFLGYLAAVLLNVVDEQWQLVRYAALGLVVNVALNLALIPAFGFLAAAWVTVLTESLVVALALRLVVRRLEMRIQLIRVARSASCAVALGIALNLLRGAGMPLLGAAAATLLLYPALLVATGVLSASDIAVARGRSTT